MSDEDRIAMQMIDPHQERQMSTRRMTQQPERHRVGWRELMELGAVLVVSALSGATAAFGLWKLFN